MVGEAFMKIGQENGMKLQIPDDLQQNNGDMFSTFDK